MTKTVAKKTASTKKAAKGAGLKKDAAKPDPAATDRKASGAKHDKPAGRKSKKPSPQTMDALEFFAYTYSKF